MGSHILRQANAATRRLTPRVPASAFAKFPCIRKVVRESAGIGRSSLALSGATDRPSRPPNRPVFGAEIRLQGQARQRAVNRSFVLRNSPECSGILLRISGARSPISGARSQSPEHAPQSPEHAPSLRSTLPNLRSTALRPQPPLSGAGRRVSRRRGRALDRVGSAVAVMSLTSAAAATTSPTSAAADGAGLIAPRWPSSLLWPNSRAPQPRAAGRRFADHRPSTGL